MKTHKNARDILPDRLLKELQEYISGETLYIPKAHEKSLGAKLRERAAITSGAMRRYAKSMQAEVK